MRVTAGSSVGSCRSRVALRLMVARIWCVHFMFLHPKELVHDRLGARDSDLQNVLAVHRESLIGDTNNTARSTSGGGVTRCGWG